MSKKPEKIPCESVQVPNHMTYVSPDLPVSEANVFIQKIPEMIWREPLEDYFTEKFRD